MSVMYRVRSKRNESSTVTPGEFSTFAEAEKRKKEWESVPQLPYFPVWTTWIEKVTVERIAEGEVGLVNESAVVSAALRWQEAYLAHGKAHQATTSVALIEAEVALSGAVNDLILEGGGF